MPKISKPKITEVKPNVDWGVYMWRLPTGKLFTDDDGSHLNIPSREGDIKNMLELKSAAAYYGQPEGELHFEPGVERATEEEFSEQESMMQAGEIHDKDYGAIMDEKRALAADK